MMATLQVERTRVASLLEAIDWAIDIGTKKTETARPVAETKIPATPAAQTAGMVQKAPTVAQTAPRLEGLIPSGAGAQTTGRAANSPLVEPEVAGVGRVAPAAMVRAALTKPRAVLPPPVVARQPIAPPIGAVREAATAIAATSGEPIRAPLEYIRRWGEERGIITNKIDMDQINARRRKLMQAPFEIA